MNKKFILLVLPVLIVPFISFNASAVAPVQTTVYCPSGQASTSNQCKWFFQDTNGGVPFGQINLYDVGLPWNRTINHERVWYKDLNFSFDSSLVPDRVKDPNGSCDMNVTVYFGGHWRGLEPEFEFNWDAFVNSPNWFVTRPQNNGASFSSMIYDDVRGSLSWCLNFDTLTNLQGVNNFSFFPNASDPQYPFMSVYNSQDNNAPYSTGIAGIELEYWTDNPNTASTNAVIAIESYMATDDFKNNQAEQNIIDAQSNNGSSDAVSSLNNKKTTLLAAMTTFVGGLHSVQQTDCLLPQITLYSLNLGQLNMCTFSVPTPITAIFSIALIIPIAAFGYHLLTRLVHMIEDFVMGSPQGGKK